MDITDFALPKAGISAAQAESEHKLIYTIGTSSYFPSKQALNKTKLVLAVIIVFYQLIITINQHF